jgi:hypothetical protein
MQSPTVFAGRINFLFVVALLLAACGSSGDQTLEQIIEQSYALDPTADIRITNRDGSIRVYGSDVVEMKLQAIKKAYSTDRLNGISIKVAAQPKSISIETKYPPRKAWPLSDRSGTVDYVLVVPQTARISQLELENGEILVEGMRGAKITAHLGSGRLFAHNSFGNLDLTVTTGNLALVYEWWEHTKFSVKGSIADGNGFVFIPSDASFHLVAEAPNGKIANDFTETEQRNGESPTRIDMLVGGGGGAGIEIRATDGNIKIAEANP